MAKKRKGPGRPPLDPKGTSELRVRVGKRHRDHLAKVEQRAGVKGEAAAVRWLIEQDMGRTS